MKQVLIAAAVLCTMNLHAQLRFPADGGSVKASVGEQVGITDITIDYGRPGVKGREGHIWGELVPEGFAEDRSFGELRRIPWRAGANENTTIEFSTDVAINGQPLSAGKYGFFIAYGPGESTLIFSKHTNAWGSFFYDEKDDALRVTIKPVPLATSVERLTYVFANQTDSTAEISLQWEKMKFPFTVSTQLQKLQLASIEREMKGPKSFYANNWLEAGLYLKEHNIELDKALAYINRAAQTMPNFYVLSNKAEVQEKLGKSAEAEMTMKDAVKAANRDFQLHGYARRLLAEKKTQKAFEIFKLNHEKFPGTYTTNVGMARGYQAIGNNKQALKYANKALPQAPDAENKATIEDLIKTLKENKVASTK